MNPPVQNIRAGGLVSSRIVPPFTSCLSLLTFVKSTVLLNTVYLTIQLLSNYN